MIESVARLDHRRKLAAEIRMIETKDKGRVHAAGPLDRGLHLRWKDVVPARDHHSARPADEVQRTVFVKETEVADRRELSFPAESRSVAARDVTVGYQFAFDEDRACFSGGKALASLVPDLQANARKAFPTAVGVCLSVAWETLMKPSSEAP